VTSIVANDLRATASPASSFRGSEPSKFSSVLAEPNWELFAGAVVWTIVMLPIAAPTATVSRVSTRSCCRHSRRKRRTAQRITARRAATPRVRGARRASP
jgi:hypothetical protein